MIGAITVERLPTVAMMGHSNCDGWGQSDFLLRDYSDLLPQNGDDVRVATAKCYWKNVFVATSPQPFPGSNHTPVVSDVGDVEWLEMTLANIRNNGDNHPHAHPYNYPNNRGACYPRYFYNAWNPDVIEGFHFGYGAVYTFSWDGGSGATFQVDEIVTFGSPTGTGRVYAATGGAGATGTLKIEMVSGSAPIDNTTITGGTSGKTATVNGTPTLQSVNKFNGTLVGLEIPLMCGWRNYWQGQVGLVKVAFSSTLMLPNETGPGDPENWVDPLDVSQASPDVPSAVDDTLATPMFNAYWSPVTMWDWSPATDRIFKLWYDKMVGAAAALPAGTKMDVRWIIPWFGDNEALVRDRSTLETSWKPACLAMLARIRQAIDDNDWSSIPARMIPVTWPGVFFGYNGPALSADFIPVDFCNQVIDEIAYDDPFVRRVDSDDWTTLADEAETPPFPMGDGATHFSHRGYVEAYADLWAAWKEITQESFDAIADDERITLGEVKTQVKQRYDRGGTMGDIKDEVLTDYINKSARDIVNHAADSCWWLNRRTSIRLTFDSAGIAALPRYVARALFIEQPTAPTEGVQFKQIAFGRGGRCQVVLIDESVGRFGTGDYRVEHVCWPIDVTKDSQVIQMPRQIMEWLVVKVCRRLASGGSDSAKFGMLAAEEAEVMQRCMRQVGAMQRQSRDTIKYGRPRVQLGYGRSSD